MPAHRVAILFALLLLAVVAGVAYGSKRPEGFAVGDGGVAAIQAAAALVQKKSTGK